MLPLMIGMGAPGVRGGRLCAAHPRQVRSGCRCLPDRTRHPRVHAGCRDLGQHVSGHLTDNVSMRALTLFHLIRATIICRSA